ncbi:hypothetical protein PoMZ_10315 [Pyricularia oryzae]|uniref:Uncharacterized protein n=1 Tax=Pyricularia oryzae TaxID=318829 RepID=A0A4P7N3V0_PYROR|nr:hypothetical protein PoMZ_10315 [Pyricularia oryzae]
MPSLAGLLAIQILPDPIPLRTTAKTSLVEHDLGPRAVVLVFHTRGARRGALARLAELRLVLRLRSSIATPPGRSTAGGSHRPSTTVLSTPTPQGPPSRISSRRPSRSSRTWCAVVGEGRVDALAEGAASGTPASLISVRASGDAGMRAPNVGRPAVTSGASRDGCGFGRRIVSGPGQKRSISGR